jgi:mono/diheme cytochrome c family protein
MTGLVWALLPMMASGLLRSDLSGVLLRRGSETAPVKRIAAGKPHALWVMAAAAPCAELAAAMKRAARFGLAGLLVAPPAACNDLAGWQGGKGFPAAGESGFRLLIVDADGIVRFDQSFASDADGVKSAAGFAIRWEQGRQSFSVHCGHCHGDDGTETAYPGVRSMAGLTARMTEARILEGAEQFGAVPVSTWDEKEVESLLLFIRGI